MTDKKIKRCIRCGLPWTYPGIKFDKKGECNYCAYYDLSADREAIVKQKLKEEFTKSIKNVKRYKHKYHGIIGLSGGKDSTYLLYYLKTKFKLNILAHTFDNGFMSAAAFKNIKKIVKVLKVDHHFTRPEFKVLKDVFLYALKEKNLYPKEILAMLSPVCGVCIGMVFGSTLHLAMKFKIPLMFIGFTPGQYPAISLENFSKVKSCMFLSDKVYKDDPQDILKILADPVREKFGAKVSGYYFRSQYISKGSFVPKILFPFHMLMDYDEETIIKEISQLGWRKPQDTDTCSTNCLLNTLGNFYSKEQYGYHPYSGELSYLARIGKLNRRQVLKAEKIEKKSFAMEHCLKQMQR